MIIQYLSVGLVVVALATFASAAAMRASPRATVLTVCAAIAVLWPVFLVQAGLAAWRASSR